MKQYIVLFEENIEGKIYKHYMVATEKTTVGDIELFCRNYDYFGRTIITLTEVEEPLPDYLNDNDKIQSINYLGKIIK